MDGAGSGLKAAEYNSNDLVNDVRALLTRLGLPLRGHDTLQDSEVTLIARQMLRNLIVEPSRPPLRIVPSSTPLPGRAGATYTALSGPAELTPMKVRTS